MFEVLKQKHLVEWKLSYDDKHRVVIVAVAVVVVVAVAVLLVVVVVDVVDVVGGDVSCGI